LIYLTINFHNKKEITMSEEFNEKYNKFINELRSVDWRDRSTVILKHLDVLRHAEESGQINIIVADWSVRNTLENCEFLVCGDEKIKENFKRYFLDTQYKSEFKSYLFEILDYEEEQLDSVFDVMETFSKNQLLSLIDLVDENVLKKMIKSKDANSRIAAYTRLGINNYIDEILKDKVASVRILGLRKLRYGDSRLKAVLEKERATQNLRIILSKIAKKDLVHMIAKEPKAYWGKKQFKDILALRLQNGI